MIGVLPGVVASGAVAAASTFRLATSGTEDPSALASLGASNILLQPRTRHVVQEDCDAIILDEPTFYVDGATYADVIYNPPAGTVFRAALEIGSVAAGVPTSNNQRVLWSGADIYTHSGTGTSGWFSSDPLPASAFGLTKFTKGDVLWARRAILFPSANPSWLCNDASDATNPTSGESVRGATNISFLQVDGTGALTGTAGTALASSRFLRPVALRGVHSGAAVKGMGNSILHGKGGNRNGDGSATNTNGGPYVRAFYLAGIAFQKSGRDGNRISNMTAAKMPVRLAQIAAGWYSHVFFEPGTNDVNNAALATVSTDYTTAISVLKVAKPDLKVIGCKIGPRTTSTDLWATVANQTPLAGNVASTQFGPGAGTDILAGWNTILAGFVGTTITALADPNTGGYIDASSAWAWKVTGAANYATVDNTHPTLASQNDAATTLYPTLAALVAA